VDSKISGTSPISDGFKLLLLRIKINKTVA
jgi:hypothetical protein